MAMREFNHLVLWNQEGLLLPLCLIMNHTCRRSIAYCILSPFSAAYSFTLRSCSEHPSTCHSSSGKRAGPTATFVRLQQDNNASFCLQLDLLACPGNEFLDLWPDPQRSSCRATFWGQRGDVSFLGDESHWHHMAVTWTAARNGTVKIYRDGLLMVEVGFAAPLSCICSCCTPRQPSFFKLGKRSKQGV